MQVVYIEAVLMDNNELIHYGKSLGFISEKQRDLLSASATKLTRGNEVVVAIKTKDKPNNVA